MADIFALEKIQTSDINTPSPVTGAVNDLGQPTSKPSGTPDTGAVDIPDQGNQLPKMPANFDVSNDDQPSAPNPFPAPPADPNNLNQAPAAPGNEDANPAPAPSVPAMPSAAPKDIFAAEGIAPPQLQATNAAALNPAQPQDVKDYVAHQQSQDDDIAQHLFSPEQIADFKANPMTVSNMGHILGVESILPGANLFDAFDKAEAASIAQKIKGVPWQDAMHSLTIDEQQVFTDQMKKIYEVKLRGFAPTWGGAATEAAYTLATVPAWVTNFVGGGALASAAIGATGATGAGAAVVGGATRLMTFFPQAASSYGDMRIADGINITDKGQMFIKDSVENPAVSALKAAAYTSADVASQIYGGKLISSVVRTPLTSAVNALPAALKDAVYQAMKTINPTSQVSKIFTTLGWQGAVEQIGINRIDQIAHATTNAALTPGFTVHDFINQALPSNRQMAIEAGLVALPGAISTAFHAGSGILMQRGIPEAQATDMMNSLSQNEREKFVQENIPNPQSPYPEPIYATSPQRPASKVFADDPTDLMRSQISAAGKVAPAPVLDEESSFNHLYKSLGKGWDAFYASAINDMQPIENLAKTAAKGGADIQPGENSQNLVNAAKATMGLVDANIKFARMSRDPVTGEMLVKGKSLKAIYDDFDNVFQKTEPDKIQRHQDFHDYQTAHSQLELADKKEDYNISEDQLSKYQNDLVNLGQKYGDDYHFFETFAQENRDWREGIVYDNLVQTGLKSQKWFDNLTSAREKYAPAYRAFDEVENENPFAPVVSGNNFKKDPNANRIGSIGKQATGSDLKIKDIFESDVKNAAQMISKGQANRLLLSMEKFKEYYPDQVRTLEPRVIHEQITNSYDPKLRAKLEGMAELLGVKIQKEKIVDEKKNRFGSYSPMEKLIKLKIGSTEGTLAHENGHALDDALDLKGTMLKEKGVKDELQKLAEDRLVGKMSLVRDEGELHFKEELEKVGDKKYLKYIKSDDEVIANFFDAYVNTPEAVDKIAPKAKAAFEKIIDKNPDLAFIKDIKPSTSRASEIVQKAVRDLKGPDNSVPFYKDGQRKFLELSPELQKAMKGFSQVQVEALWKFFDAIGKAQKKMLQIGATSMPGFLLRHPLRAMQLAFVNTHGTATPVDFFKGIFQVLGNSDEYNKWKAASGGLQRSMSLDDTNIEKYKNELFKDKTIVSNLNPKTMFKNLKILIDHPARVAVFNAEIKKGTPEIEAAIKSLDTTLNYSRAGSAVRKLGRYSPFVNVELQSIDAMARSIKKNPAAYTAAALTAWTLPQMALSGYYLYGADKKTRDEYLNLPAALRFTAMNIKIGDHWVPFPRAFTGAYIFGSIPEQIMIHLYDQGKTEPADFYGNMVSGLLKSAGFITDPTEAIPPAIKAWLEAKFNKNFYFGNHLYPVEKEGAAPSEQSNYWNSDLSKRLGKALNVSPAVIDNTIADMSGNLGKFIVQNVDGATREWDKMQGKKVSEPPSGFENNVLSHGLIDRTPSGSGSQSVETFFDRYNEASQVNKEYNSLKNDPEEQHQFQQENKEQLHTYEILSSFHKDISQIDKQLKEVKQSETLSGDKKQVMINRLNEQLTEIAHQANLQYIKATKSKE